VRDGGKEQYWRQVPARWRSSGLSGRPYCQIHRISNRPCTGGDARFRGVTAPGPNSWRSPSCRPPWPPTATAPSRSFLPISAAFGLGRASIELRSFVCSTSWRTQARHVELACHGALLALCGADM